MATVPDEAACEIAVDHVLTTVYPGRHEGEVVGAHETTDGTVVGVKVAPAGYISTAKYALVTVDFTGDVVAAEECTKRELDARLGDV